MILLPIETERLLIRPLAPDSAQHRNSRQVYCDPQVMRFIPGGPLADEDAVRAKLESYASAQAKRGFSSWAVVERETGRLLGDPSFG